MKNSNLKILALGASLLAGIASPALAADSAASVAKFHEDASRLFGSYHGGAIAVTEFSGHDQKLAAALDRNNDGKLEQSEFVQSLVAQN